MLIFSSRKYQLKEQSLSLSAIQFTLDPTIPGSHEQNSNDFR
jgi:hypothetical protein